MSFITCIGTCCSCGKMMSFHPNKVPSFKGEPLCETCIGIINERRIANHLPTIKYDKDAYVGAEEQDIDWY